MRPEHKEANSLARFCCVSGAGHDARREKEDFCICLWPLLTGHRACQACEFSFFFFLVVWGGGGANVCM